MNLSPQEIPLSDRFQTLWEKKREILLALAVFGVGLGAWIGFLQAGPDASQYAQAQKRLFSWIQSPQEESLLQEMKKSLHQFPDLQQRFEPLLAQKYLDIKQVAEALPLAHRSLKRVHAEIPFHAAFAAGSLLIEQGIYQEAFEQSVALKEQLSHFLETESRGKDPMKGGVVLYAHTLIRIACLQQVLKNGPGEKAAWEEVESYLFSKERRQEVAEQVLSQFSDRQVDLAMYIQDRKREL